MQFKHFLMMISVFHYIVKTQNNQHKRNRYASLRYIVYALIRDFLFLTRRKTPRYQASSKSGFSLLPDSDTGKKKVRNGEFLGYTTLLCGYM